VDGDFFPEDGEQLLPVKDLKMRMEAGRFTADIIYSDGETNQLILYQRSFAEVVR